MGQPIRVRVSLPAPKTQGMATTQRSEVRQAIRRAKLVDALDLGATGKPIRVRVSLPAPKIIFTGFGMAIEYDKKRNDITFCTMLFKMPVAGDLNALKHMTRKFEEFYLPSLKNLIKTFGRIALWCDKETADFIKREGLDKNIHMRVMDFCDLPHYGQREEWLGMLRGMRGNVGYLLHHKTPEQWIDYLILIAAKPSVMDWAAAENKFNSDYFMWIDAGSFNPMYANFWNSWTGSVTAHPTRVRITVAPTLGKTRPHFVPKFVYNIYRKIKGPIAPATHDAMARQDLTDIAMINADYDVPASSFMIPTNAVHNFYTEFERVRLIMKKHRLVSTEQAVFQAMMKFDVRDMFEVVYIHGYDGVYAAVAGTRIDAII